MTKYYVVMTKEKKSGHYLVGSAYNYGKPDDTMIFIDKQIRYETREEAVRRVHQLGAKYREMGKTTLVYDKV